MDLLPMVLVICAVSAIFAMRNFVGATILGLLDVIGGLIIIGFPKGAFLVFPSTVTAYIGGFMVLKGVYSIVTSFR